MIGINLFDFQEKASNYIKDFCLSNRDKDTLVVKAPTGSGKTIILIDFIERLCREKAEKVCFVWLTPGSGDLEEQSKEKCDLHLPSFETKTVDDVIANGFDDKDICFFNWEKITKSGNRAISPSERSNLYKRIKEAQLSDIDFIIIVDEEHQNNTSKADDLISFFAAKNKIRVSATANRNRLYDYYEIDEEDVIQSGLITKALFINEDVPTGRIDNEEQLLLNLANTKRDDIKEEYEKVGKNINPLVLIQFPSESPELIEKVEEILSDLGKTYENGLVAIHMADRKENIEGIKELDSRIQYLLIKQAISTGWDCPRAKILVKLRENMSEVFELQTLGRLRRMPEAVHYDNEVLDDAFLYTFDEKYKESVFGSTDRAYERRTIFLKNEFRDFKLTKQLRNKDIADGMSEREIRTKFAKFFTNKYSLNEDLEGNKLKFYAKGFETVDALKRSIIQDRVEHTSDVTGSDVNREEIEITVNTHSNAIDLMHEIDSFKSLIGLDYSKTRALLEYYFRDNVRAKKEEKLLNLNTAQFYAFIINNAEVLRKDFREGMIGTVSMQNLGLDLVKEEEFKIPVEDKFKYVPMRDPKVLEKNVYKNYTDECLVEGIRSKSERLFERWINEKSDWFYKNGDSGQLYFSIVYVDGNRKQHLFYADYICSINGEIWVIETKGGEKDSGEDNNIDINVINKFNAFKEYAQHYNVNWGFVRDKYEKLYINNTEYTINMDDANWKSIDDILG